ncbi:MAG: nucleoid occlusion factor SlmA [Oleispira antarctica]|uniref:Nucleoid occlusion factor SlmA n=1 Tax=Oleispira antarctica RB-8 TaxID=698738 RepID=R4YST3_OLEAN|nr:nucleoid occlusion factor SlmA [Oleispira antarctica]MBQ0790975.1 nucleoid occlusion factor SlmA [Oleispira antarctica]CCK78030.1 Transcriptional regulator, TetR family [Oleispira antarctica RB-8]
MSETEVKISRREQILQAVVHMLEANPGGKITTANIAKTVGVSEAALYRHFPSKAKMFEGLIEFIEDAIFSRTHRILQDFPEADVRCEKTLTLVLTFAEKNPGMCRLLAGDALAGETDRLRHRIHQFFERLETQLKQILREAELREQKVTSISLTATANMLNALVEGRIRQYVRTEFSVSPTQHWPEQWKLINQQMLRSTG